MFSQIENGIKAILPFHFAKTNEPTNFEKKIKQIIRGYNSTVIVNIRKDKQRNFKSCPTLILCIIIFFRISPKPQQLSMMPIGQSLNLKIDTRISDHVSLNNLPLLYFVL